MSLACCSSILSQSLAETGDGERQRSEDGKEQKSEVRGQMSEVGSQKKAESSKGRRQRTEGGGQKTDDR